MTSTATTIPANQASPKMAYLIATLTTQASYADLLSDGHPDPMTFERLDLVQDMDSMISRCRELEAAGLPYICLHKWAVLRMLAAFDGLDTTEQAKAVIKGGDRLTLLAECGGIEQ